MSINRHPERHSSQINPTLKPLEFLIGEWRIVATHPDFSTAVTGEARFDWLQEGAFLLMRSSFEQPGPPAGRMVFGKDDSADHFRVLYFDDRGVSRVYKLSLEAGTWKMWRNAPGFSQRFTATLSEDGNTMAAFWERSSDGKKWEIDLELTYIRVT